MADTRMDHVLSTEYADVERIAEALNIHTESVRRLIRSGALPNTFKLVNKYYMPVSDLKEFAATYHNLPGARPRERA